ncbi:MAG: FKBP-type peptidyl-prolyl cis-trans isomerase [Bacteroidota bacterium]
MKKQFSKTIAFTAVGAVLAITACDKSPYPGYDMAENGVYTKFYKQDESGVKAKEGDIVKLILSYKNSKDSVLFDSKKNNPNGSSFIEFPLSKSSFKGSFEEALSMMSVGDSASFIISADSVYLKTFRAKELPPYIEKGSMLTFDAKLEKVTPKDEVEKERNQKMEEQKAIAELRKNEEPKMFSKYLEDNKINAKPTASGLYYIEKAKGKGPKPAKGSMVKVNYTGRLLDGTVFDTSDEAVAKEAKLFDERRPYQPIEFPLGEGQVIPGWDEGISLMSVGSKAQLIIPSSIGYGEQGAGPIPPFSPLVFDVELVSFTPAK